MNIENGAVQGLELETGFSTSSEISQMTNALTFMSTYKWEMGDVNAFYIRKQLLSDKKDAKGNRIPYKGTVTEVATAICISEGMKEEDITPDYLFQRFNKDTDIQALSEFTRGIMTLINGKKMTKRVLCKNTFDETGKRIPSTMDKLAGITGAIHQTLRKAEEDKCVLANLAKDIMDDALKAFDEKNKLIRAVKTRVAMEICAIPVDPSNFAVKDGFAGLKGVIYTTNTDNYDAFKKKLHTADDSHLDFLELRISHPVISKSASKDVNKMQSGLKTTFETFDATKSPANLIKNFADDYLAYCATAAQSAQDLRAKVMDYREITDEELLTICKDYVLKNYDVLNEEEREKHEAIVQRFQEVLTAEEIASISNIQFAQSPNVKEAEGMTGVEEETELPKEETQGTDVFDGLEDEEGFEV